MPLISSFGALSSRGLGQFTASAAEPKYIEDYFSTYLYTGNGSTQTVNNGIGLADTAEWSTYKLREGSSLGIGITTDTSGNVYVTGYANDGSNYCLVAKYDTSGSLQWQRKIRQGYSYGNGITQ